MIQALLLSEAQEDYVALPQERQQRVIREMNTYLARNVDHPIEQALVMCVREEYIIHGDPGAVPPRGLLHAEGG